jgi:hypothetical protein
MADRPEAFVGMSGGLARPDSENELCLFSPAGQLLLEGP